MYPEKSLKWAGAFCLIVGMSFAGVKFQQIQSVSNPGLPNQLEISKFLGYDNVQESLERGISFSSNSFSNSTKAEKLSQTLSPNS